VLSNVVVLSLIYPLKGRSSRNRILIYLHCIQTTSSVTSRPAKSIFAVHALIRRVKRAFCLNNFLQSTTSTFLLKIIERFPDQLSKLIFPYRSALQYPTITLSRSLCFKAKIKGKFPCRLTNVDNLIFFLSRAPCILAIRFRFVYLHVTASNFIDPLALDILQWLPTETCRHLLVCKKRS
jgi:hypothetical protein